MIWVNGGFIHVLKGLYPTGFNFFPAPTQLIQWLNYFLSKSLLLLKLGNLPFNNISVAELKNI